MAQLAGGTFTGRAIYDNGVMTGVAEDVADIISSISPYETPLLAALGDAERPATSIFHEWLEDELSPNVITTSVNIASTAADTLVGIAKGLAAYLQVGAVLIGPDSMAGPEYFQVTAISGNTITLSRGFGGTPITSLSAGAQLSILNDVALDGADVTVDTSRPRTRHGNITMIMKKDVIISGTVQAVEMLGGVTSEWDLQVVKKTREALRDLNKAVIRSRLSGNTFGNASANRTMAGILQQIVTNQVSWGTLTAENLTQSIKKAWDAGGTDVDLIVCGDVVKHVIDGFNATRQQAIQGSGQERVYSDNITEFECTYGVLPLLLDRWMPPKRFAIISRARTKVVPLRSRSFQFEPVAKTGDATKGMVIGEYTTVLKNEEGMVQGVIA